MPGRLTPLAPLVWLAALATVSACAATRGAGHQAGPPCAPSAHQLFAGTLSRLVPSRPFRLGARATAWAATSNRADQDQLFAGLVGIAEVSVIASSAAPHTRTDQRGSVVSADPSVDLHATGQWYRLPVRAGSWRVYTPTLGGPLQLTVIGCPGG